MTGIKEFFKELFHDRPRLFMLLFFAAYLIIWFIILPGREVERNYVYSPLDDYIPFVEAFIIPYCLWFFYFAGPLVYFLIVSREDFLRTGLFLAFGMTVSVLIFFLLPNGIDFRPETLPRDNALTRLTLLIYSMDEPHNVFPSNHCFVAIGITVGILRCRRLAGKRLLKSAAVLLCALICLSTVFIKQHSVLDFFGALVLCIPAYVLGFVIKWPFIERRKPAAVEKPCSLEEPEE